MVALSLALFSTSLFLFVKEGMDSSLTSAAIKDDSNYIEETTTKTGWGIGSSSSLGDNLGSSDLDFKEDDFDEQRVDFNLELNQVVNINSQVITDKIVVTFDGNGEELIVNGETVEFGEMTDVKLELDGFYGDIDLNNFAVSLNGHVSKIYLNDFSISSSNHIDVYFERAHYSYVEISNFAISELILPYGDGELQASSKLSYELEEESVTLGDFEGDLVVIKGEETSSSLIGKSNSLSLDGDLLAFDLW